MPLEGLQGRRALVTGAASGIGSAICERLGKEGVEVVATDIHPASGIVVADLTDAEDVERLSGSVSAIDFLVNAARGPAVVSRKDTLPPTPHAIHREDLDGKSSSAVIAANLTTASLWCRGFAPRVQS